MNETDDEEDALRVLGLSGRPTADQARSAFLVDNIHAELTTLVDNFS